VLLKSPTRRVSPVNDRFQRRLLIVHDNSSIFQWRRPFDPFFINGRSVEDAFEKFRGEVISDYGRGVDLRVVFGGISSGKGENNFRN
jgi:hypothetical protein